MQSEIFMAHLSNIWYQELWVPTALPLSDTSRREITDYTVQSRQSLQTALLHPLAAVHHFDWQLRGGPWRADESEKPISASEATVAVLCSPAHLPPPPPALLPASCRPSSLLSLQPIKSGHHLMEEMYCLQEPEWSVCLLLKHQGNTRKHNIHKLVTESNRCISEHLPDICRALRNFRKHSCTERLNDRTSFSRPAYTLIDDSCFSHGSYPQELTSIFRTTLILLFWVLTTLSRTTFSFLLWPHTSLYSTPQLASQAHLVLQTHLVLQARRDHLVF